jgi:hypothetical protein
MTQLAEEHRHQLLPAGETAGMPLRIVLLHGGFKFQPGEKLENLTEYAAYSSHGRGLLLPLESVLAEPDSNVAEPLPPPRFTPCTLSKARRPYLRN